MQKITGPKTDPCGTPNLTIPSIEQEPRISTRCTLFLKYEQNKKQKGSELELFKHTECFESTIL